MNLDDFIKCKINLFEDSKDTNGFIQQSLLLNQVLPIMLDAKLIDSEDYNEAYYLNSNNNLKINGYSINETGERLQLFTINEETIDENLPHEKFMISIKPYYENQFKRVTKLINLALDTSLSSQIQEADPIRPLIYQLESPEGIEKFDVIEIFLISFNVTVTTHNDQAQPRTIHFPEERKNIRYSLNGEKKTKEILIFKKLIDLNFLLNSEVSRGLREPLLVDFEKIFGENSIEAIQVAKESKFESYLCVLPAPILAELYKRYSSRLLEKNIRSFLQFKGVNKGIRDTIKKEPEKFIAYNNGLTITASKADKIEKKGKLFLQTLTDFQIVNGGQTTSSIYFSKKDGIDITKVKVMAKINVVVHTDEKELDELISNISNYSNAQTRVSSVDLRSRSPQLVKLKLLSETIITPSGLKWFFERAKGEFNTKIRNNSRVKKEYPIERRFTKEQLAKYYSAWGNRPYLVKKGGEKIFRYFIEELNEKDSEEEKQSKIDINRDFYESLIAKIILFRNMEKIYGQGPNSLGQIRSAVIPYSISVLYIYTDGSDFNRVFNFSKIWSMEQLDSDLKVFIESLLRLINDLIKKYAHSEDLGEYSKKKDLWDQIKDCQEVRNFMSESFSNKIISKYSISKSLLG